MLPAPRQSLVSAVRGLQPILLVGSLAIGIWALWSPGFRDESGSPTTGICVPLALAAGTLVWGLCWPHRWRACGGWLALAIVGQAVTLQLIDAGPRIHYQHLRLPTELVSEGRGLWLAALGLQAALVMVALRGEWSRIAGWLGTRFRASRLALVVAIALVVSAAPSPHPAGYGLELLFAATLQLLQLLTIVVAVRSAPQAALEGVPEPSDRLVPVAVVFVVVLSGALSLFVYQGHPHVPDEVAYFFQARTFASGRLSLPAPAVPEAFEVYTLFIHDGRWFSIFPPGWPALLAAGFVLGVPWLVNPLLGGLNLLLAHRLVRRIWDPAAARWAVLLLATSPWFVFMAMNLMSHTLALTCALAGALLVARALEEGRALWSLAAGVALGLLFLTRPLDGAVSVGFAGLVTIAARPRLPRVRILASLAIGFVLTGGLTLVYNRLMTGGPLVFPLELYYDLTFGPGRYGIGFGSQRGLGWALDAFPGHGPLEAVVNTLLNLFSVNVELHGWSIGSLLLPALFVVAGRIGRREWLALAWIAVFVGAYGLYWYSGGPDFGARYWYLIIVPCVILTVRGAQTLADRLAAGPGGTGRGNARARLAVAGLCLLALVTYFPWRALDKYRHYLGMRPDLARWAEAEEIGRSLVLIRGKSHPDYASAVVANPLDFSADRPIFAWDRDEDVRRRLIEAYPDRELWVVAGPSITESGYRVVEAPAARR